MADGTAQGVNSAARLVARRPVARRDPARKTYRVRSYEQTGIVGVSVEGEAFDLFLCVVTFGVPLIFVASHWKIAGAQPRNRIRSIFGTLRFAVFRRTVRYPIR